MSGQDQVKVRLRSSQGQTQAKGRSRSGQVQIKVRSNPVRIWSDPFRCCHVRSGQDKVMSG